MNPRNPMAPQRVWLDGVVVGGLLGLLNLLLSPGDPGWFELNPTPWLLLPVLMGARYGFIAGMGSGSIAVAVVVVANMMAGNAPTVALTLQGHAYWFMSMLLAGGLAGELWLYFRRRIGQLEVQEESLASKVRQLDSDAMILREAKNELDRITAARDGEISSLDAELRRLYTCTAEALPSAILSLLKRQARVSDAALYRPQKAGADADAWSRFALIGHPDLLPEKLSVNEHPMAAQALLEKSLVTLPEILRDENPADETVLMAVPLLGAGGDPLALLIVAGMPFIAFTPSSAELIDLVGQWSGGVLEISEGAEGRYRIVAGRETQRIYFMEHFVHLLDLALLSCQRHRLPSAVVEMALPEGDSAQQAAFETVVLGAVRSGDFACAPEKGYPAVWVLLPLSGERGTDIFIERCTKFCLRQGVDPRQLKSRRVDLSKVDAVDAVLSDLRKKVSRP